MSDPSSNAATSTKVVVATTVALSFISFWRGAAIVLSDLGSTMFYVGGIAEKAIGESAAWFVLAVMFFSFAVRSLYMESCSMFVRGGVYVVVRDALGPTMARISVSALVVDYILTGPISVVAAGQYLGRLLNEISEMLHSSFRIDPNYFAAVFGVAVTGYFWWSNTKGIHESSGKALRILQITTVMVAILLIWCPLTLLLRGSFELPALPSMQTMNQTQHALGWLHGTFWSQIPFVMMVVGFGHSMLAMSGFETLAQIYREIAYPKLKNLKLTANIVCFYALFSTGVISMFAVMIIPDAVRPQYYDNLIGGLAMSLAGPEVLRLTFHIFVVIVGVLILSGAVNTSIIGANGVFNRVAEDGVLLEWFRRPHHRFGTTYRIINMVTIAQMLTIIGSRGDVYLLGEAYAFGVVWSFSFKGLGVLALRFQRRDQEYKIPLNFRIGKTEIPVGLGAIVMVFFFVAIANLFTKQIATYYGVTSSAILYVLFLVSEKVNRRRMQDEKTGLEKFNLDTQPQIVAEQIKARAGAVLVAVRGNNLEHLRRTLQKTNLRRHDIIVMTVRPLSTGAGEFELKEDQIFSSYEQELFSKVVELAEREGKHVELLVVPAVDPFDAMVQTSANLKVSKLVTGVSERMTSDELARSIGLAWERLPEPRHPFSLEVISPDRPSTYVNLGPHPPRLWPEDIDRLHELWLRLSEQANLGSKLHHRDVIGLALRRLSTDLDAGKRDEIVDSLERDIRDHH
ncbi:MAG TPA: APC family permease [Bryobacteraceae bacterium]|nr:APC family permease [Bryobacteraceae bacterium]